MKKLLLAAGLAASIFFAACTTAQQDRVLTVAQQVNAQVVKACAVYKPVAADIQAIYVVDPKVQTALGAVNGLCTANAATDITSLQTLSQTTLPAAIKGLATAGLGVADQQKIGSLLTAVNVFIAAAYAVHGTPTVLTSAVAASGAPVASAPTPVSTPLAGSAIQ
ncbi:conserved exported protein of unknown function [Burkholderia multivorans]